MSANFMLVVAAAYRREREEFDREAVNKATEDLLTALLVWKAAIAPLLTGEALS